MGAEQNSPSTSRHDAPTDLQEDCTLKLHHTMVQPTASLELVIDRFSRNPRQFDMNEISHEVITR